MTFLIISVTVKWVVGLCLYLLIGALIGWTILSMQKKIHEKIIGPFGTVMVILFWPLLLICELLIVIIFGIVKPRKRRH